ncbi:DEAD/DEAH box helicase [Hespellia stercorisuis]|uniref:Type III restriction enzyme, res subunit n=1 Tax=Hespellia stercorisuis DSM 15480 TaxID=1121950 RepID=A0A1M6X373_9FIRM|nr:DEAD/DEAH box helicase family protein [Hespellia stercorisuis]SHL00361.1 Type III restriction enzyme, res subunit [Hespellia stercorisuis DSM 15480]
MDGIIKIEESNMVLQVSKEFDPSVLNMSEWDDFLDCLCGTRDYQKQAIKTAIIYMASGEYESINQLAKVNYSDSSELQEKYRTEIDYINTLQLPNKLSGVIDLATGTGKSYVMYGISQLMLGMGLVKRVLVLCPSITIEKELQQKFRTLSQDAKLKSYLPSSSLMKNPRIIDANVTIGESDICIENIHTVYANTGSSIEDSFKFGGQDTLVLSDEVHHAYNSSGDADIKKWKEFLLGVYNFKYLIGLTGTAYIENEYFSDVIYRFSLREAIDKQFVKMVEYVAKDEGLEQNAKFQKIYANHIEFKKIYSGIKPLTLVVSKDIRSADCLANEFIDFL